jgi:hypothetical protein
LLIYIISSTFSLSTKAMKLHLALAGLTFLFPFAAVAQEVMDGEIPDVIPDETEWGKNMSPADLAPPDKGDDDGSGSRRSRALDQIQSSLPTDRKLVNGAFNPSDFCDGTPIVRSIPCPSLAFTADSILLQLLAGFTYTIDIQRIDCELDPFSFLFAPDNTMVAKNDDSTDPLFCPGPFQDPRVIFETDETGIYKLDTVAFPFIPAPCPTDGDYDYQVVIQCARTRAGGGVNGDPHFKTWRGLHFDYHGECDLVLAHSPSFESGLGLDVHVRTQIRRDFSYIAAAALRIGTDILEVASQGVYYLNGEAGADLPNTISGYTVSHTQPNDHQHVFDVDLGDDEHILIKVFKDFVSVMFDSARFKHFGDSVGIMGGFEKGRMLARNGGTVLDDPNEFGQEWQVLDSEPKLFQTNRLPQHPQVCAMPPPKLVSQVRRRLSESTTDEVAAEKACAHWSKGKDDCIFDVLATGDLEMAIGGAY